MAVTTRRLTATAALTAVAALTGCQGEPAGLVATPPSDAEPAQVVQTVVDAINAREHDLVEHLSTPGFAEYVEATWMQGGYLTEAEIGATLPDQGVATADPDAVGVVVSFVPEQTDASIPDGERISWVFLVTDASGRWLVLDAGGG